MIRHAFHGRNLGVVPWRKPFKPDAGVDLVNFSAVLERTTMTP